MLDTYKSIVTRDNDTIVDRSDQQSTALIDQLKTYPNFVVYTADKVPHNPRTGKEAKAGISNTWASYEETLEALEKHPKKYKGLGYEFEKTQHIAGIDLDHCIIDGKLTPWARKVIEKLNSYTELSPSGDGIHIWVYGTLPKNLGSSESDNEIHLATEMYDNKRYFTITGKHLSGTPLTIEHRQKELLEIYTEVVERRKQAKKSPPKEHTPILSFPHITNAYGRAALQEEYDFLASTTTGGRNTQLNLSAFKLGGLVASGELSRSDVERELTNAAIQCGLDEKEIEKTLRSGLEAGMLNPREVPEQKTRRQYRSVSHIVPQIDREAHEKALSEARGTIEQWTRDHIRFNDTGILLECVPPGVGKSAINAKVGLDYGASWIAQRWDMISSVEALGTYKKVQCCNNYTVEEIEKKGLSLDLLDGNCPHAELANRLAKKGYNARAIHKYLCNEQCDYIQQFNGIEDESTVYVLPHVKSRYPAQHTAIITDEFTITDWLPEREITITMLKADDNGAVGGDENSFSTMLQALISETKTPIHGKAIFDALDKKGHLTHYLGGLAYLADDTYPFLYELESIKNEEIGNFIDKKPHVVMRHIVKAFLQELTKWQTGKEWNSCIRIGPSKRGGYALYITEVLQFTVQNGKKLPPWIILDATADKEVYSRILGTEVTFKRVDVPLAPGTHHIAVRTGKRYGKISLTARTKDGGISEGLQRAIKECRALLKKVDPEGEAIQSEQVGLISFDGCIDALASALNIPGNNCGHYWGIRGSNQLEHCTILFLVGTPTLDPHDLMRLARAVYRDDLDPIGEKDPRLQHLSDHLCNSELTQCAHRIRPLCYENRTVISLCIGDIDFLPISEEITELPSYFTEDGQDRFEYRQDDTNRRLEIAYAELSKDGKKVTKIALAKAAKVREKTARDWFNNRMQDDTKFQQKNGPSLNVMSSYSETGRFFENSPHSETGTNSHVDSQNSDFAPPILQDIPSYKGIVKGQRVTTPVGEGTVERVYVCHILNRVRAAVYVDTPRGTSLYPYDMNEIQAVKQPLTKTYDEGIDLLFRAVSTIS